MDVVTKAHRQRLFGDEVELLDLLMDVAGALLEVRPRLYADQGDGKLDGPERVAETTEFPWYADPAYTSSTPSGWTIE
jgi:hypothetical protein